MLRAHIYTKGNTSNRLFLSHVVSCSSTGIVDLGEKRAIRVKGPDFYIDIDRIGDEVWLFDDNESESIGIWSIGENGPSAHTSIESIRRLSPN